MSRISSFIAVLAGALLSASCASEPWGARGPKPAEYVYTAPKSSEAGLPAGRADDDFLDEEGMLRLGAFFGELRSGRFGEIHSVLVAHRGRLVVEEYFPGTDRGAKRRDFGAGDLHDLASVTKSVCSLCVGIAADRGWIDIDRPFLDYLPSRSVPVSEGMEGITVRHLLTMTAGFRWDETSRSYFDLRNDAVRLYLHADPLRFILSRKAADPPGERWNYSGACTNLLGEVLRGATGMRLDEFAREYLFDPLGVGRAEWIILRGGLVYASGDARMRPRDMMKIGLLVRSGGVFDGKPVVSGEWIDASLSPAVRPDDSTEYGFQWWLPTFPEDVRARAGPLYLASGRGDQYIAILPDLDLVAVVTGGNYRPRRNGATGVLEGLAEALLPR
jgi:CubicO group peptidase (beta-lactamase class C family)